MIKRDAQPVDIRLGKAKHPSGSYWLSLTTLVTAAFFTCPARAQVGATILTQPLSQTSVVGGSVTFSVVASGSDMLFVWFCNGAPLPRQNADTLTLTDLKPEQAGLYYAQILNRSGNILAQSDTAQLTLPSPDLVIDQNPEDEKIYLGSDAAFAVIASAKSPVRYQWLFNGRIIPGATEPLLRVPKTMEANAGTYMVRVSTDTAAVLSRRADLTLAAGTAPVLTGLVNQEAFVGGTVILDGVPTAPGSYSYLWHFNAATLLPRTPTLTLSNIQPDQAGLYWLSVSSPDGVRVIAFVTVTVIWLEVAPIADLSLNQGTSIAPVPIRLAGDEQSLSEAVLVATSSNSNLIAPDDIFFSGSGPDRLMIPICKPGVSGSSTITVTASHRGQSATTTFKLTVIGPNTPPVIENLPEKATIVLGQPAAIPFTIRDEQTDSAELTCTATLLQATGNCAAQITGTGAQRILLVTFDSAQTGDPTAVVVVRDSVGASAQGTVSLSSIGPRLSITREGLELVIAYAGSTTDGVIEYRYDSNPPSVWRPLGYTPVAQNGQRIVRIPMPANNMFLRLHY